MFVKEKVKKQIQSTPGGWKKFFGKLPKVAGPLR